MSTQIEASSPIAAVILAAGGSTRMGTTKQLLPISGQPMVRLVAQAACDACLDQVLVVVGADSERVSEALAGLPVEIVDNEAWAEGLSTSIRAGLNGLRSDVQAVLFILGDQVALSAGLLRALVDRYHTRRAPIVAPAFGGRRTNPVLFDRSLIPELLAVDGDEGGRSVVARHFDEVELVQLEDAAQIMDVDTQDDYRQARVVLRSTRENQKDRG